MFKSFEVGEKRFVVVKNDEIRLFEDGSSRAATFSYPRWAQFVEFFDEINNAVGNLVKNEEVKLRLHIGALYYVSVASGYRCDDIKKYYLAQECAVKPTKTGIALRLFEWSRLQEVVKEIKEKHPKVAEAQPCWTQTDHFNWEGTMMCVECNMFGTWSSSLTYELSRGTLCDVSLITKNNIT
jgi:hypothetical protein